MHGVGEPRFEFPDYCTGNQLNTGYLIRPSSNEPPVSEREICHPPAYLLTPKQTDIVQTSVTNVGSATLFNPVKQQAHYACTHIDATLYTVLHALHVIYELQRFYCIMYVLKHCMLSIAFYFKAILWTFLTEQMNFRVLITCPHIISTDEDFGLTDRKLCSNKFTWCFHKQKVLYVLSPCNPTKNQFQQSVTLFRC